jgi:hypothetical protein
MKTATEISNGLLREARETRSARVIASLRRQGAVRLATGQL